MIYSQVWLFYSLEPQWFKMNNSSSSTVKEQRNIDEVKLSCSVVTYDSCSYKVKLLFNSIELRNDTYVKTWTSPCQASVKCLTSSPIYQSRGNFLKCEVKDDHTNRLFLFRSSRTNKGEKCLPDIFQYLMRQSKSICWLDFICSGVTTAATTETTILTGTADGATTELKGAFFPSTYVTRFLVLSVNGCVFSYNVDSCCSTQILILLHASAATMENVN